MRRTVVMWTAAMLAALAASVPAAGQWVESDKLIAPDAAMTDGFGFSVGVSGDTIIVGSFNDDDYGPESDSGSAYLFDAITGNQLGDKLTASDADWGDTFGTSVAISGNIAIVGAPDHHHNGDANLRGGSAYLFNVTTGAELYELIASDAADRDYFGFSVGISGNTAIVGAYGDGDGWTGAAYLFNVTTGQQIGQKLVAPDAAADDEFGAAVAISGSTVIVGARADDDGGDASGSAYLFNATTGLQIGQKLIAPDDEANDLFGTSVAVSGYRAIVGAPGNGGLTGAAYLFDWTTDPPVGQKLTAPDGLPNDVFGSSVAISGNAAIVGAYGDDTFSGSAYLFDLTTGQPQKITASDPSAYKQFGLSVAVNGGTAVIGAIGDSQAGMYGGAAYVYASGSDSGFRLNGIQVSELELPTLATPVLAAGDTLSGQGTRDGVFVGQGGSAIVVDEGNMTLGDPASYGPSHKKCPIGVDGR
ncbi:MAG: FG-GAP repeat protein [Candidatus Nealsonbacteria bacterium]|nr:FG-GAP repeat protein [Candidatus Nealsonbacteria bacterium]